MPEETKRSVVEVLPTQVEHDVKSKKQHTAKGAKKVIRKYKQKDVDQTSPLGVLQFEIDEICQEYSLDKKDIENDMKAILNGEYEELEKYHRIVENVSIIKLTSNGDGLAIIPGVTDETKKQVAIVPFGLPGDVGTVKVFKSHPYYVECDLLEVTTPSSNRKDELINCKYFGKCSGCQYQNVDYETQLIFKKQTIENAYKFLAKNITSQLPPISDTEPSPLQYSYRTKLTPHFDIPWSRKKLTKPLESRPDVGFGSKGRPTWRETAGGSGSIVDIEECSIGTAIINKGMDNERRRFEKEYNNYKKGATILLREDTKIKTDDLVIDVEKASTDPEGEVSTLEVSQDSTPLIKTCVTKSRQIVSEYVNGYTFEFSAGEFFQNNNSILPQVTEYVKANLTIPNSTAEELSYLVDAYCGSGLFSITCSTGVSRVIGVEISADSVKFAQRNAEINKIENAKFIVGKAEAIFNDLDVPSNRTSVILDPPRKGCDEVFLSQLSKFNPAKVVYISCNVHSQARDIDWFLTKSENGHLYQLESIKGFDFFPQTHHVESVAVLSLK